MVVSYMSMYSRIFYGNTLKKEINNTNEDYYFKIIYKCRVKNRRYKKAIKSHGGLSGAAARTGKKR